MKKHPDQHPAQPHLPNLEADLSIERQRSQEALRRAIDDYTWFRAGLYLPDTDTFTPPPKGSVEYKKKIEALEAMARSRNLLEDIPQSVPRQKTHLEVRPEPALTITIPVAINKEKPQTIARTLELIKTSQQAMGRPVEIIIWANARYDKKGNRSPVEGEARERYENLKQMLQQMSSDDLRFQTALQVLPTEEATMVRLRTNYMEALAIQAAERSYAFDHPILWLDADTTSMSRNTLAEIEESVRGFDAFLIHANGRHNVDWAQGQGFSSLDAATKAVIIDEIQRRQDVRLLESARREDGRRRERDEYGEYFDEPGLSCMLGTYLEAGGVLQTKLTAETGVVFPFERAIDEGEVLSWNTIGARKRIFRRRPHKDIECDAIPLTKYISTARLGGSARRLYQLIAQRGVEALLDNTAEYILSSNMVPGETLVEKPITQEVMANHTKQRREHTNGELDWAIKIGYKVSEKATQQREAGIKIVDRLIKDNFVAEKDLES